MTIKSKKTKRSTGEQQLREFFAEDYTPRTIRVSSGEQALTLSPFFAGVRLYCSIISSLPLVVYTRQEDGGREKARDNPAYKILHDKPNPAQTRAVFIEQLIRNLFIYGNAYALIQRDGSGQLTNLFPLCPTTVREVIVDSDWNKAYYVAPEYDSSGELYQSEDVLHFMMNSRDGIQGTPLLKYAAEALGLSKQVQEAASSYYRNAVRTPIYVKTLGKIGTEARKQLEEFFATKYAGALNSGKVPVLQEAELASMPSTSAVDNQLLAALGSSVADIARWLNLSPIALGDYSAAHYASLSADNVYLYQRSIAPVLAPIEQELNSKLFTDDEKTYAEFTVDAILRGDPREQAETLNVYIQNGTLTRNEARAIANRDSLDGLDVPLQPANMVSAAPEPVDTPAASPAPGPQADAASPLTGTQAADAAAPATPVANAGLNGAQVASILQIVDKVSLKQYPPATAIALIEASFPLIDKATIETIVNSVAAFTPAPATPAPTPGVDNGNTPTDNTL